MLPKQALWERIRSDEMLPGWRLWSQGEDGWVPVVRDIMVTEVQENSINLSNSQLSSWNQSISNPTTSYPRVLLVTFLILQNSIIAPLLCLKDICSLFRRSIRAGIRSSLFISLLQDSTYHLSSVRVCTLTKSI